MKGFGAFVVMTCRLHFRNRLALVYGYLFPLVFLAVFWVLYRHDPVPLAPRFGQLLTITALGGACFGLPTTLVAERDRGVWRHYRSLPASTPRLLLAVAVARLGLLFSAGLLQLLVACGVGMSLPVHPTSLALAFAFVCFAFIGLGLMIAMLADSVAGVQALGQCVFLPLLIVGGVAVPLAALPEWADAVSLYFPGRYAVEALQAATTGTIDGRFLWQLAALACMGVSAGVVGVVLFRSQGGDQPALTWRRRWAAAAALLVWVAWGWGTHASGWMSGSPLVGREPAAAEPAPWERVTEGDVAGLDFNLPPDDGVVAPIEWPERADGFVEVQLAELRVRLPEWGPGREGDPVQQVRNLLCVAAVPDVLQMTVERYVPLVVMQHLLERRRPDELVRILAYIALHPDEGDVITSLPDLGLGAYRADPSMVRERVSIYATKFVARLTGRRTQ